MLRLLTTLCATAAALLLAGCGSGSHDSADSADAAASVFPTSELHGQLAIGKEGELLSIDILFSAKDFSTGGTYKGNVLAPQVNDEEEVEAALYNVSGSIRQTTQSIPGHVYLQFPGMQPGALSGTILLELPASGRHDEQRSRAGSVQSCDLQFTTSGGATYPMDFQGEEVQITW